MINCHSKESILETFSNENHVSLIVYLYDNQRIYLSDDLGRQRAVVN